MKKILLTGCAIAFFCGGTMAQNQDSTSNNLRNEAVEVKDEVKQDANQLNNEVKQDANQLKEDAQQTGNEMKQEAEQTGDQIKQEAGETKEKMEQSTDRARDRASEATPAASIENNAQPAAAENSLSTAAAPQAPVEVVEDKEGPNNQVVYKYQDGFYYVDRDKKEFVKIEESQLKDAQHNAIVSDKENKKQDK